MSYKTLASCLAALGLSTGCSNVIVRKCADGELVTIPKSCSQEYEIYARKRGNVLILNVDVLKQLAQKAKLEVGPNEEIVQLSEKLDQKNIALRTFATESCVRRRFNPCSPEAREAHKEFMDRFLALEKESREARDQAAAKKPDAP